MPETSPAGANVTRTDAFPGLSASVLAGCAAVGTGYLLGAEWLGDPIAGIPFGLWLVGAGTLVRGLWVGGWVSRIAREIERLPEKLAPRGDGEEALAWPEGRAASACCAGALLAARGVAVGVFAVQERLAQLRDGARAPRRTPEERALAWLDARPDVRLPQRPVRIGVWGPEELVRGVLETPGAEGVLVVRSASELSSPPMLEQEGLDAKIVFGDGQAKVRFREDPQREASWYDWSTPRPVTYGTVFPQRVDPAMVTFALTGDGTPEPRALRMLAEAGAVLSRLPVRLALADRFAGRLPMDPTPALRRLAELVAQADPRTPDPGVRAAAQVVSAWLVTDIPGMGMEERRRGIEAAAGILAGDVGALLRVVAARFGGGDVEGGLASLEAADEALRRAADLPDTDHHAFVQAEIDHAGPSEMSLGRVAAGICLVAARTPPEKMDYLADDLLDELRYADWLLGNDPDALVLHRVIKRLRECRIAETRGLPQEATREKSEEGRGERRLAA